MGKHPCPMWYSRRGWRGEMAMYGVHGNSTGQSTLSYVVQWDRMDRWDGVHGNPQDSPHYPMWYSGIGCMVYLGIHGEVTTILHTWYRIG